VERRAFPSDQESYHLSKPVRRAIGDESYDMDAVVNRDALQDFGA
jgi:hypothetical protein